MWIICRYPECIILSLPGSPYSWCLLTCTNSIGGTFSHSTFDTRRFLKFYQSSILGCWMSSPPLNSRPLVATFHGSECHYFRVASKTPEKDQYGRRFEVDRFIQILSAGNTSCKVSTIQVNCSETIGVSGQTYSLFLIEVIYRIIILLQCCEFRSPLHSFTILIRPFIENPVIKFHL